MIKTTKEQIKLINGDALIKLKEIKESTIHLIITDPPYFIDRMGCDWNRVSLNKSVKKAKVIGALPVGMKFDVKQGIKFQNFMNKVATECYRILKPGGFFISFSQARLYHRLGMAVEDAGFEIRDMLGWKYEGQAKAFSQTHFVKKMKIDKKEKQIILDSLENRKTPQLKPQIEPMVLAMKPKEGTFVDNWMKYETGLINTSASLDGKFPGNIMEVSKPRKNEKGNNNNHLTVKPVKLIEHLIDLFSKENQVILDPFMGSGSHGIAAQNKNRKFIGIEIDTDYYTIAEKRILELK